MLRKSVVFLTALLCSATVKVYALGLGDVTVESALNQPLRVRIEVLDLGDTRLQDVVVEMASNDDFDRFNITRVAFLNSIRFGVDSTAEGDFVVLTSQQVVREPFLSFILETRWPNGRLLSEHTILLDLPVFGGGQPQRDVTPPVNPLQSLIDRAQTQQTPNVNVPQQPEIAPPSDPVPPVVEQAPVQQPQPAPEPPPPAVQEPAPRPEPAPPPAPAPAPVFEEPEPTRVSQAPAPPPPPPPDFNVEQYDPIAGTFETMPGDSLYGIARRVRPDPSVSLQQTMIAIQRENPDAFINNNINRLRSGEILRIPDLEDIQAIDPREAIDEVARQNREAGFSEPLTPRSEATPPQQSRPQGQLSVITSETDAGGAGVTEANSELDRRIAELESQLAVRMEEADRARRERQELEARFAELEGQIQDAQEIIRLQDLQLAQLQDSLAEAAVAQAQAEAVARAAAEAAAQAETVASRQPLNMVRDIIDDLMGLATGNSLIMMIAGGAVFLLLLLVLLLRRRGSADDEDFDFSDDSGPSGSGQAQNFDADDDHADLDDFMGQNAGVNAVPEAHTPMHAHLSEVEEEFFEEEEPAEEAYSEEMVSAVNEEALEDQVAVLITHGQLPDAATLLDSALATSPDNHDLRLKYCEVLALQEDRAGFDEQATILAASMSPGIDQKILEMRSRYLQDSEAEAELAADDFDAVEADDAETADSVVEDEQDVDVSLLAAEKKTEESGSFLDDLGIDLDDFEDDEDDDFEFSPELSDDEAATEESQYAPDLPPDSASQPEEASDFDSDSEEFAEQPAAESTELEFEDSNDMDLTFALSEEGSAEDAEEEEALEADDDDGAFDLGDMLGYEPDMSSSSDDEIEDAGEFSVEMADEAAEESSDFTEMEAASTESAEETQVSAFDTGGADESGTVEFTPGLSSEPMVVEEMADDADAEGHENALDFDYDRSELAGSAGEADSDSDDSDVETFEFDVGGMDEEVDTEETPATDSEPSLEFETVSFDSEGSIDTGLADDSDSSSVTTDFEEDAGVDFDDDSPLEMETDNSVALESDDHPDDEMEALEDASNLLDNYSLDQDSSQDDDSDIGDFDFDLDDIDLGGGSEVELLEPDIDEPGSDSLSLSTDIEVDDDDDHGLGGMQAHQLSDDEPVESEAADDGDDLEDLGFLSDEEAGKGNADKSEIESITYDDDFEFLSDEDETATKLELAYAYQKMGDTEGAREILQEVTREGSDTQVKEAKELMATLESTAN